MTTNLEIRTLLSYCQTQLNIHKNLINLGEQYQKFSIIQLWASKRAYYCSNDTHLNLMADIRVVILSWSKIFRIYFLFYVHFLACINFMILKRCSDVRNLRLGKSAKQFGNFIVSMKLGDVRRTSQQMEPQQL